MNVAFTVIFFLDIATQITQTEAYPNWHWSGRDKQWSHHHSEACCTVGRCVKALECPKSALAAEYEKDCCIYKENGPWVCCLKNDESYHHWEDESYHWEDDNTYTSGAPNNFRRTTAKPQKVSTTASADKHWYGARKPPMKDFKNLNEGQEQPRGRAFGDILKNDREKIPLHRPINKTIATKIPRVNATNGIAVSNNKRTTNLWDKPRTISPNNYKKTTNFWDKPQTPDSRIVFPTYSEAKHVTHSPPTKRVNNYVPTKRSWSLSTSTKAAWAYTAAYTRGTTSTTKHPYFKKSTTSTKASTQRRNQIWGSSTTIHSARAQPAKPKTTSMSFTARTTRRYGVTTPLPNVNMHLCGIGNERTVISRQRKMINYGHNPDVTAVNSGNSRSRGRLPYQRIVGGEEAEPFSWPWVAALYKVTSSGGNRFLSAGSLINEDFILTAAHVFTPEDLRTASYVVMLGTHDAQDAVAQYIVSRVLLHPNYEHRYYYNDIALLKLQRKVIFSDYIMPVCLPSPNAPLHSDKDLIGKNVTVMGWGDDSFGGKSSQVLKDASFPIVSRISCNASYVRVASNSFPRGITADMLCAADPRGGKDACQGDSGGPLTVIENRRYTQVGIVSFGFKCGDKEFPGVYTKVAPFLSWIAENTKYVDDNGDYEY